MQAYYELQTVVPIDHQLTITLPAEIPAGKVKIAVIYDVLEPSSDQQDSMAEFLSQLPVNVSGLTRNQIHDYLEQERQSWD